MYAIEPMMSCRRYSSLGAALLGATLLGCMPGLAAAEAVTANAAFNAEDLVRLKRLSDPQVSPNGRYVVYTLRETDIDANRGRTDLWLLDLKTEQAPPRRLTQNPANDSSPRWSADGSNIYFLSTRSGNSQVWRLPLEGGEALQVTSYPRDVGSMELSPDGKHLAVTMEVFKDCNDLDCTHQRLERLGKEKATGRRYDQLFVRHWDAWADGTHSNLFTAALGTDGRAASALNVSGKVLADIPSKPNGGSEEYAFSRDGTRLIFSARLADSHEPWSTNFDLYDVPVDGSAAPVNLTADNSAWDTQPVFLADGNLAYLAMDRPGFEADRFHIVIRDARSGAKRPLTAGWDFSVSHLGVMRDGKTLLANGDEKGQHVLYAINSATGKPTRLSADGYVAEYSAANGGTVVAMASLGGPADLYFLGSAARPRRLTRVNDDVLSRRAMSEYQQFSFKGWNDETVYGYVMKPFGFAAGHRYPIAFIVHGGPQSSFQNQWSYRWNPQVFAGHGYAVVFIDFHGSPGYGQKFTDSISEDWGGKPLLDLQKGLAAAIEQFSWLDGGNACSLGASYGGYMQNWIAGNWSDRFKCIVNHDGIFDTRSMYYTTEELWFAEWENGGTYYDHAQKHEQFNPANYVKNWRTPMLVIHGAQDFRVPDNQGIATFTALQRRGIESRLLYFPDENHWVLKPANSLQWHRNVLEWLDQHLLPTPR